jgi:ComF family protein
MRHGLVDGILDPLAEWLAPRRCPFCDGSLPRRAACDSCFAALPWNRPACRACAMPLRSANSSVCAACLESSPPQDCSWTAFRYEPPVVQQIVALKFRGDFQPARTLASLIAEPLAARAGPLPELLIPMPLHAARLRTRGYNQALEIAREIAARLSIPLATGAARRVRATVEQTALSAAERRHNVRGVFAAGPAVAGRHVALFDDVITTGATIAELARTVRKAGATRVEAWAVARA